MLMGSKLLASLAGVSPPARLATTLAISSYAKDDPVARSQAGVMSPVLFLLPTLDPLYPAAASGQRRAEEESEDMPSITLFGVFQVESHNVYAAILVLSAVVYVLMFALIAPTFDVRTPDPPDHRPPRFSGVCAADALMCLLFAQSDFEMPSCEALELPPCEVPELPLGEIPDHEGSEVLAASMENIELLAPGLPDTDEPADGLETQSNLGTGCGSTRAAPHIQDARSDKVARLRPLAIRLFFVIGHAQFAGLLLALMYVLTLDDDHRYSVAAWVCTMCVGVGFPASIFYVCCFMMPAVVEDRKARLEGAEWVECRARDRRFYYNVLTEESQWGEPAEFKSRAAAVPAVPLEISTGIDCLIDSYHGENSISRYFALVELCHHVTSVAMVMTVYWRGSTKAAWFLTAMQVADAMLTTVGMPLIDSSDSQRNVENKATAAASWLMAGGMAVLAVDMYSDDWHEERLQWLFMGLSLLASLTVPLACFIDSKFPPASEVEGDKDDSASMAPSAVEFASMKQNPLAATICFEQASRKTAAEAPTGQLSKREAQAMLEELRVARKAGRLSEAEYRSQKQQLRERTQPHKEQKGDPGVGGPEEAGTFSPPKEAPENTIDCGQSHSSVRELWGEFSHGHPKAPAPEGHEYDAELLHATWARRNRGACRTIVD
eukprot:TRINITY_DN2648_c0_g1_i3.p1 TRINITY_DN2648_c0_g1~~TRINITY_DN2648_c0_g1_i3.p1  ORF type:complete len:664 (+),score=141.87 TRINITY_DN2648_c0_g1_i3:668-2659(+)